MRLSLGVQLIALLRQTYGQVTLLATDRSVVDRGIYEQFGEVLGVEVVYNILDHRYSLGVLAEQVLESGVTCDHLVLPEMGVSPEIAPLLERLASQCRQLSYYDDDDKQRVSLSLGHRPRDTPSLLQGFLSSRLFQEDKYSVVIQQKEQQKYTKVPS